ncbi:serine hydrolase domain-containing protein [Rhodohalobacter sp. 8-1]|uniref:serine hydrolase domain-containing protein n=1 Tax=Rhodohalobacter sp. 8-1 TaxID=3131972 RepID=UPI0030EE6B67
MRLFLLILAVIGTSHSTSVAQPSTTEHRNLDRIFNIGTVQSLMIEKDGELLYEEFRDGMTRNTTTNIKSASKSIISLLMGIAIDEGHLEGVDQTIGEFFPDYFDQNPNQAKESITIRNLLTMRSGLETTSFHNYGRWVISDNWVRFALDQPLEEEKGGQMVYSTGTSHLLSVILTKATGMSTLEFANEQLFGPMNISVGGWDRDPQGYYMGGNNLAISPLALLKIGNLILNGGVYNGEQIVPQSWIMDSIDIYTRSVYNDYDYGYMWWRKQVDGHDMIFAWGNGGQYIMILTEFETVISITSDLERSNGSRQYQRQIFTFIEEQILPYLRQS